MDEQNRDNSPETPDDAAPDAPETARDDAPPPPGAGDADVPAQAAGDGDAPPREGEGSLQELIARQRERLMAGRAKGRGDTQADEKGDKQADTQADTQAEGKGDTQGEQAPGASAPSGPAPSRAPVGGLRPRFVQTVLLANTLLIVVVVGIMTHQFATAPATPSLPQPPDAASATAGATTQPGEPAPMLSQPRAMSWAQAEAALASQNYQRALAGYRHLYDRAAKTPADSLVADLLTFRRGYCLAQLGRAAQGRARLREATEAGSPVVRAAAWYQLGLLDLRGGQYLQARTKAYRALGAVGAVAEPLALQDDCDALAARAVTGKVLSMYAQADAVPWSGAAWSDPFAGLSDSALRDRLRSGAQLLDEGLLGPQVARGAGAGLRRPWRVRVVGGHLDELFARLGAQTGVEIRWINVPSARRTRAVTVFASGSQTRIAEIASGAAGLVARFTGESVDVYDPRGFDAVSEARDLLTRETNACWRRLLLRRGGRDDARAAAGRFALAVVQELSGDVIGAIKEYQLIAGRFDARPVAPRALLRCARLRLDLGNEDGARNDLQRLLDKYPDFQAQDEVYLALGEANRRAGRLDDAIGDFRRLFVQNLSPDSRAAAAYGLGRCYHAKDMPDDAATWLTRFIGLADRDHPDIAAAYLLRGRCRVSTGESDLAEGDLRGALASASSSREHVDAALALGALYLDTGRVVRALGLLSSLDADTVPETRLGRYLELCGRMYRTMGLPGRAVRLLGRHIGDVPDAQDRARVGAEVARCYLAADQRDRAEDMLTQVLEEMAP
ncbi:MAG: tetratricopeptide repeat protein, partial [Planctomycetota bacterium]